MNILVTGVTGYIGQRLILALQSKGHNLVCCVRDKQRFDLSKYDASKIELLEIDFLKSAKLHTVPADIDAAYYLIHSMASTTGDFKDLEAIAAENFKLALQSTNVKQVIYLGAIVNEAKLSKHFSSRLNVERILADSKYHLTTLRAGIVVGSGSASFEIIRDLVEKLPVMIAPKWLKTKSQPIAVRNVIQYLEAVLLREETYDKVYDIGGPDVLSYSDMLMQFAKVRKLNRFIIPFPVMTPRLSSYWLYFVTSTSYKLAVNLVNSMKVEVIARDNNLAELLKIKLITYEEAVRLAFDLIAQQEVLSSWKDALTSNILTPGISKLIEVPVYGCFKDKRKRSVESEAIVIDRIWTIGGAKGWYYANWLWHLRGFIDKLAGGVGLRRGRKNANQISVGETLDFWRVIYANKTENRLMLYAEMKLPGEAWLEFKIVDKVLYQTATFRPHGLWGRIYWNAVLPFHGIIFNGMISKLSENK